MLQLNRKKTHKTLDGYATDCFLRNTVTVGAGHFQPGDFCGSDFDFCRIPAVDCGLAGEKEKKR
jgi:hypothetical protein